MAIWVNIHIWGQLLTLFYLQTSRQNIAENFFFVGPFKSGLLTWCSRLLHSLIYLLTIRTFFHRTPQLPEKSENCHYFTRVQFTDPFTIKSFIVKRSSSESCLVFNRHVSSVSFILSWFILLSWACFCRIQALFWRLSFALVYMMFF